MPIFDSAALARQMEALPPDSVYRLMTVPPAKRPEAKWPYAVLAGGQGADVATTIAAMQRPGARELNPMGPVGVVAAKVVGAGFIAWLMHRSHEQGNNAQQKVLGVIGGALGFAPAIWNVAQIRKK